MQITHYCNSFIRLKENNTSFLCDPWVGLGNENAWLSFPIYKNGSKLMNNLKPNFIYISHLHCDHYDSTNLPNIKNKNLKIIIKNFSNKRLKKKIKNLGFKNILELQPWKKYKLNRDISVAIIPQMSSNSENNPDSINYDLDTSIIIQSNKTKQIFFNNVDNPLSLSNLRVVRKFIKSRFKKDVDICCSPSGTASEYPHCFTNLNRIKEKNRLIGHHLKKLVKQVKILKAKNYFDAGGIYTIYGKFYALNKFIASPSTSQIRVAFKRSQINFFTILGGNSLIFKNSKWEKISNVKINNNLKKKIINNTRNEKYFYEKTKINFNKAYLDNVFDNSKEKYYKVLKNFKIKSSWKIDFYIYKNLILTKNGKINKAKSIIFGNYSLDFGREKKNFSHLKCHLDLKLFYGFLNKKYVWNPAISGSVIIFERKSSYFDPNLTFSLNFLNN